MIHLGFQFYQPTDEGGSARTAQSGIGVTKIGHHGTGQVEVRINEPGEVETVMELIQQAYLLTVS